MSVFLLLFACNTAQPPQVCADLASSEAQDTCRHNALIALPPTQAEQALTLAAAITDPIIRGAGIIHWVETHKSAIDEATGFGLCALLPMNTERSACERRFSAAHLQR